ncbi:hypothetical protein [Leucobacter sp. NPDC077196]|uniref:hypothetical protein n=1 Tax=Leucobacter sp. NPDC077196 TaxID=3154959 RepID=UPI00343CF46F
MTEEAMPLGTITITRYTSADGETLAGVNVDDDLDVHAQLGLLRMAEDTILRMEEEDE